MKKSFWLASLCGSFAAFLFLHPSPVSAQTPFGDERVSVKKVASSNPAVPTSEKTVVTIADTGVIATPAPEKPVHYVVQRGDTLSSIAARLLGDPARFWEIVEANLARHPSIRKNPNLIFSGWDLIIPKSKKTVVTTATQAEPVLTPGKPAAMAPSGIVTSPAAQAPVPQPTLGTTPTGDQTAPVSHAALINATTRVLHIGDSHTVGIYGTEIDSLMRQTGAKVETFGVAGSSPSWWWKGTTTRCGYVGHDENGKIDRPADWRTPRQTPIFQHLLKEFQPTVVVISLGANLLRASEKTMQQEVSRMMEIAKTSGAKIIWVGPPRSRETPEHAAQKDRLCETIQATVLAADGSFIDSRPLTHYPATGGDGLHYWGTEGSKTAKAWANSVFQSIQKK